MLRQRCRSISASGRRSPVQSVDARYSAGWALTEIVLIVFVPCFSWLVWNALSDDSVSTWQSAASVSRHGPLRTVRDMIALQEGKVLVVHRNGELRFWDQATNADAGFFSSTIEESRCGSFAPQKRLLAVGSTRGTVRVWDVSSADQKPHVFAADSVSVCALQFTEDEKMLITGGGSAELKLWDTTTWKLIASLPGDVAGNAIHSLHLSADGQFAFTGTYRGTVCKWKLADRSLERILQISTAGHPDSLIVGVLGLTGSDEVVVATREGSISVWNHKNGTETRRFRDPLVQLISVVLTPDAQHLIGVNEFGKLQGWDIASGNSFAVRPFTKITAPRMLAVSGDGSSLIAGDNDGEIEFQPLDAAFSATATGKDL